MRPLPRPRSSALLPRLVLSLGLGLGALACDSEPSVDAGTPGVDAGPRDAGPPDAGPDAGPSCEGPPGLYAAGSCSVLAEGVRSFAPRYPLWADAAVKERYISLPEGETIDSGDPDQWVFPAGTVIWKTFSTPAGLRLETRRLEKTRAGTGSGGWRMQTFVWNEAQDAVTEVVDGQENVLGTDHDVPSQDQCWECHNDNALDPILGFSAIQLRHEAASAEEITLGALLEESRLSTELSLEAAEIPGEETQRAAMGYLHANCGHCHREVMAPVGLRMWVDVGAASLEETPLGRTALNIFSGWSDGATTHRILGGDAGRSAIPARMALRDVNQMPPFATEVVDEEAVTLIRAWIDSLPAP